MSYIYDGLVSLLASVKLAIIIYIYGIDPYPHSLAFLHQLSAYLYMIC